MEPKKDWRIPSISDRHPGPAEAMRLIEKQNALNGAVASAPTLQEQLTRQAVLYAAANAPHNSKVRRGQ